MKKSSVEPVVAVAPAHADSEHVAPDRKRQRTDATLESGGTSIGSEGGEIEYVEQYDLPPGMENIDEEVHAEVERRRKGAYVPVSFFELACFVVLTKPRVEGFTYDRVLGIIGDLPERVVKGLYGKTFQDKDYSRILRMSSSVAYPMRV